MIVPVKIAGGGVYIGDMAAMQGDGEIAGHTTDVAGIVVLKVHVIKGLKLEGPIILPILEDLPYLARPLSRTETMLAEEEAAKWGVALEDNLPISFVGTGANLNVAIQSGLSRAADLLKMPVAEVMNRATITGSIEIGRAPGVVTVTFLAPAKRLREKKLSDLISRQYGAIR